VKGEEKWYAIDVQASAVAGEAVEAAFNILEAIGTEIDTLRKTPDEFITVTGYFNEPPETELVQEYINESLQIYGVSGTAIRSVTDREVENEDWLAEWKRHWKPTTVGKFIIAPPWSEVIAGDKIVIRIEPNMAFGTGTHATTALCLTWLESNNLTGRVLVDYGCGSGILGIAALKLGAQRVHAIDIDPQAQTATRSNAARNGVSHRLTFDLPSPGTADVLVDTVTRLLS